MQLLGKVVDTPVVYNDRGHGPDIAVPGQGCCAMPVVFTTGADVQKTFEGVADAVLLCLGRPCDHAALMAMFMAMGRLMVFSRISAFFALLRVVPELSASAN